MAPILSRSQCVKETGDYEKVYIRNEEKNLKHYVSSEKL